MRYHRSNIITAMREAIAAQERTERAQRFTSDSALLSGWRVFVKDLEKGNAIEWHDEQKVAASSPLSRIILHVPAVPVAQPRARATAFNGHARVYENKKHPVTEFKATVRMALREAYTGAPLTGPLRVDCLFIMPRPAALVWKTKPMPRLPHDKKPDRDNLDKAVMDALKGLAWVDDSQAALGEIQKWIAGGDEQPHAVITITQLEGELATWTHYSPNAEC